MPEAHSSAAQGVETGFYAHIDAGRLAPSVASNLHWHAVNSALAQAALIEYSATLSVERAAALANPIVRRAFDETVARAAAAVQEVLP